MVRDIIKKKKLHTEANNQISSLINLSLTNDKVNTKNSFFISIIRPSKN